MFTNYIWNSLLKSAGLAIKTGGSALARTTVAALFKINAVIYTALAAGDLPALTAVTIADGYTKAVLAQVDSAGAVTYKVGDAVANVSGVVFSKTVDMPQADNDKAPIGWLVIKASGAAFVGGTTALDESGITVSYIDAFGFYGA